MTNLTSVLFDPIVAVRRAEQEQPVLLGIAMPILYAGCMTAASMLLSQTLNKSGFHPFAYFWFCFIELCLLLLVIPMAICLISFFATLLGGKGSLQSLAWGLVLSLAPGLLSVPIVLLLIPLGAPGAALGVLAKFAIFFWIFALQTGAVAAVYRFSVPKAAFVLATSYGVAVAGYWIFTWIFGIHAISTMHLWFRA